MESSHWLLLLWGDSQWQQPLTLPLTHPKWQNSITIICFKGIMRNSWEITGIKKVTST